MPLVSKQVVNGLAGTERNGNAGQTPAPDEELKAEPELEPDETPEPELPFPLEDEEPGCSLAEEDETAEALEKP
ncbi:MAG: hypothetical protein LBR60_01545, partial [Fibrobacter sp.]|nr:hypothetical protein [Fibrobacter sp.]